MKVQRIYGYYIITIQILCCWVSATTSRPFAPPYDNNNHHNGPRSLRPSSSSSGSLTSTLLHSSQQQPPLAAPESSSETMEEVRGGAVVGVEMSNKIGSSPPSCEHKCYGCFPCEAIQVPTIATAKSRVGVGVGIGVMYTNYEPEGWKCKCGPSFYSPYP